MRTLLCLLIGVLALLWRAVPSFSWTPASCSNVRHSHLMQDYNYGYYCGGSYVSGNYPRDTFAVYYTLDGTFRYMYPGTCYCCWTYIELRTYGDPSYPTHVPTICLWFTAPINGIGHCCYDYHQPRHYPGEWSFGSGFNGVSIEMWWG